jgi:hypothetical protein
MWNDSTGAQSQQKKKDIIRTLLVACRDV